MKMFILTLTAILQTLTAADRPVSPLNDANLKKVTANNTVSLKITLKNGVTFDNAYIKERSTTYVFNNRSYEREKKPSIIIFRSYGRVNIAVSQIKSMSSKPADKNLCKTTTIDHIFPADMLEMIELSDLKNPEKFNDDAAKDLGELLPVLQELYLQGGSLSEKSVDVLAKLKRLTHLGLNKDFSDKGIAELKKKLPLTRIKK